MNTYLRGCSCAFGSLLSNNRFGFSRLSLDRSAILSLAKLLLVHGLQCNIYTSASEGFYSDPSFVKAKKEGITTTKKSSFLCLFHWSEENLEASKNTIHFYPIWRHKTFFKAKKSLKFSPQNTQFGLKSIQFDFKNVQFQERAIKCQTGTGSVQFSTEKCSFDVKVFSLNIGLWKLNTFQAKLVGKVSNWCSFNA